LGYAASSVILVKGNSDNIQFTGFEKALAENDTQIRLFGKPEVKGERRMGVCLALGNSIDDARRKANQAATSITYSFL
jgi:phosphoribosylglycinamide formyltransferase 2